MKVYNYIFIHTIFAVESYNFKELSKANAETVGMVNDLIKIEEDKLNKKKNSLETLLNSFVESTSKTMQHILKKKMQMLKREI